MINSAVIDLFPAYTVNFTFFKKVTNLADFTTQLKSGKIPFGVLNANKISSWLQFLCGIQRALLNQQNDKMKTKNIYSEVLFALSDSESINESMKIMGVAESMIVYSLSSSMESGKSTEDFIRELEKEIIGEQEDLSQLWFDWKKPSKQIKLDNTIITDIALKGFTK